MYFEGLNSDFANFIAGKVKYNLYIQVLNTLANTLFETESHSGFYRLKPLFNFDTVSSSNSKDHTENNKDLTLRQVNSTMLYFKSDIPVMDYKEITSEYTIDGIKYTLYYTYDSVTGEPAPRRMTSNGNVTDEYGYYLDSEVVE